MTNLEVITEVTPINIPQLSWWDTVKGKDQEDGNTVIEFLPHDKSVQIDTTDITNCDLVFFEYKFGNTGLNEEYDSDKYFMTFFQSYLLGKINKYAEKTTFEVQVNIYDTVDSHTIGITLTISEGTHNYLTFDAVSLLVNHISRTIVEEAFGKVWEKYESQ